MKIRKSFFIRWLMSVDKGNEEQSIIDIEHVQSGNKHQVFSLEEANQWMKNIGISTANAEESIATEN